MMKIHLINLNKYKDNIYNFLFYRDNLVYFYVLLYNIALLLLLGIPAITYYGLIVLSSILSFMGKLVVVLNPFLSHVYGVACFKMLFGSVGYFYQFVLNSEGIFFQGIVFGENLIFPFFILIIIIITYFQKDRIIDTRYYQLFKIKLIDLFENNFTVHFLLFFVIFVFYLFVCLSICFLAEFNVIRELLGFLVSYSFLFDFRGQIFSWFLPFLYSYFFLFFWILIYQSFMMGYSSRVKYIYIGFGVITFLAIYLLSPLIFLDWEGGIYLGNGFYNWYVIYKLFRYFIIYPIVTSFLIGFILSLFLYFFKK